MAKMAGSQNVPGNISDISYKSAAETLSGAKKFSGNVGFYNTTPIAQPATTPAVDASALVILTDTITVLTSMRTSYNDLITKLKALGLLGA